MVSQMTSGSDTPSQKSVAASGACDQAGEEEAEARTEEETEDDDLESDLRLLAAGVRLVAARDGDEGVAGPGVSGAALPARDDEERVLTMMGKGARDRGDWQNWAMQ